MNSSYLTNRPKYINVGGRLLDLSVPKVMGIINVTPDSFYEGSRVSGERQIIETAARMTDEGASVIDVGGVSTRPYAPDIAVEEEERRVLDAIRFIIRELPGTVISVDTFRASVARKAVEECGALIINDISGGEADSDMFSVVRELNVPYIMMHMQGTPRTMQENPVYEDVVADILKWFSTKIYDLQSAGVKDILLDPGIGFGKSINHNFEILRRFHDFTIAGLPLVAGVSRKSMIWKTLGITPGEALNGTTVLNSVALMGGADILRVHDVKEAAESIKLINMLINRQDETQKLTEK
ncbi:MAG TPA: dihydropteroate synthase [Bacteroidales bacterium]|nr:dihydropteroate synthase [Bacteroidales bacterium]HPF03885.1 dihydropteroate synthase [Bacteroidales bacterium]HPR10796.1 dihydropteroate synthase [Bacteroidales bacterium]HRW85979.1 dihydropteroate synthase [Bacteroidales bacterium]